MAGGGEFSNAYHFRTLSREQPDGKKYLDVAHESRLKGLLSGIKGSDNRLLVRAKITGAWMSVRGTTVSGTVISSTKFRDF